MPGKVLIVDDIATNRIVLNVKLNAAGYTVIQASSGQDGLESARREQPDLLLLPSSLPDMPVTRLLSWLARDEALRTIPAVALLESHETSQRLALLEAGAADVLSAPPDTATLLARFRALLRAREGREEALLQEQMKRALGFCENGAEFETPPHVSILAQNAQRAAAWAASLDSLAICSKGHSPQADMLRLIESAPNPPDILLVECAGGEAAAQSLSLISDLRAGPNTRHCGLVVTVPGDDSQLLAHAFDRGADDVLAKGFKAEELRLKVRRLARRKRLGDARRAHMQAGLHAAITDPLTGLFNRRYALPHLEKLTADSQPGASRCAVMALDIDHFKRINDQYGHQVGDSVLTELADLLKRSLRKSDIAARIGGEEFLVILPETSRARAQETAQRLCRSISRHAFRAPGLGAPLHLTVSIGLAMTERGCGAELPARAEDAVDTLLARADAALYGSKRHGRNQVTISARNAA